MTPPPSLLRQTLVLIAFVVACLAVGAVGGLVTAKSVAIWYPTLAKPSFNPPNWVFGPVWTSLYLLMAIAAWLVWRSAGWRGGHTALWLFIFQLALNLLWSLLFFGFRLIGPALLEITLLLAAIVGVTFAFRQHSRLAALLMLPYLAWVGFATLLTGAIWRLN